MAVGGFLNENGDWKPGGFPLEVESFVSKERFVDNFLLKGEVG